MVKGRLCLVLVILVGLSHAGDANDALLTWLKEQGANTASITIKTKVKHICCQLSLNTYHLRFDGALLTPLCRVAQDDGERGLFATRAIAAGSPVVSSTPHNRVRPYLSRTAVVCRFDPRAAFCHAFMTSALSSLCLGRYPCKTRHVPRQLRGESSRESPLLRQIPL